MKKSSSTPNDAEEETYEDSMNETEEKIPAAPTVEETQSSDGDEVDLKPIMKELNYLQDQINLLDIDNDTAAAQITKDIKGTKKELKALTKSSKNSGVATRVKDFANLAAANVDKFHGGDPVTITSGVLGLIGAVAMLAPPPKGAAVGSAFSLASSITGIFGNTNHPAVQFGSIANDIANKVVQDLKDVMDSKELDELNDTGKGVQKDFEAAMAWLDGLTKHGIKHLSNKAIIAIPSCVPIYKGSDFISKLGVVMQRLYDTGERTKREAVIKLLPLYTELAVSRDLVFQDILNIYAIHDEALYDGFSGVLQSRKDQDYKVFDGIKAANNYLWVLYDAKDNRKSFENYRTYQMDIRNAPPPQVKSKGFGPAKAEGAVCSKDYVDFGPIISKTGPLITLKFIQKQNRIALHGTVAKYWDLDRKLLFGTDSAENGDMGVGYFNKPEHWDMHTVMVDDIQTQAVFGAQLFRYGENNTPNGNRVGIKIYYGSADGDGSDCKWKNTSTWGEKQGIDFFTWGQGYGPPFYNLEDTDGRGSANTGYIIGACINLCHGHNTNQLSLYVWKAGY
eukprot:545447_1